MAVERTRKWPIIVGAIGLVLVVLAVLWDWNWLRGIAEQQASAALGRRVSIGHFDVKLGTPLQITARDVRVANVPPGPEDQNFAEIARLDVLLDLWQSLRAGAAVLPRIELDRPRVNAMQAADGTANWNFPAIAGPADGGAPKAPPRIGLLRITDGQARVRSEMPRADFTASIVTRDAEGQPSQIMVDASGTYGGQPVEVHLLGGALLSLRDTTEPYAIDLQLRNGPTKLSLKGTVSNPLNFAGADLRLEVAGPDMELLLPLTGIPIPPTPPYQVAGQLHYADGKFRFSDFAGKVGVTDVAGTMEADTTTPRLTVSGEIVSKNVDLADLGGFIGSQPGRLDTPGQTAEQRAAVARAEANPKLLPTVTLDIGKLRSVDVHVRYQAARIRGRNMPFDSLRGKLDIVDGHIALTNVAVTVGKGEITATINLTPAGDSFRTKATADFNRLDLGRLLNAADFVKGGGEVRGRANIESTGSSLSAILGNGNGALTLFTAGGNVSALVVDLSGLQFGRALLSALGLPNRTTVTCAVGDFVLQTGVLTARTVLMDTPENVLVGAGSVNLRNETVDMRLKTDPKNFTVGSLPAPIAITGPFKNLSVLPEVVEAGARVGVAAGLGLLFPPAAILPTIQLGVGENDACATLFGKRPAKGR